MILSYPLLFGLNLLIEELAAILGGFGKKRILLAVFVVNLITHPLLTFVAMPLLSPSSAPSLALLFTLESIVVAVEALLLWKLSKESLPSMFALSLGMNLASLGIGLML